MNRQTGNNNNGESVLYGPYRKHKMARFDIKTIIAIGSVLVAILGGVWTVRGQVDQREQILSTHDQELKKIWRHVHWIEKALFVRAQKDGLEVPPPPEEELAK